MAIPEKITFEENQGALVGTIRYRHIDYMALEQIKRAVDMAVCRRSHRILILDLSEVDKISSLVMGSRVDLLKQLSRQDRKFVLVGMSKLIRGSFSVTRLDQLFEIYDNVRTALAALATVGWHS